MKRIDRIRQMDVLELAKRIVEETECEDTTCRYCTTKKRNDSRCGARCEEGVAEWLEEDV